MGLLLERDCHQLGNAGHEARRRGILQKGESLKCSYMNCDQVNCELVENPLVRTVYIASAQIPVATPVEGFYRRLERHFEITGASR
jgi:hypothetical protein